MSGSAVTDRPSSAESPTCTWSGRTVSRRSSSGIGKPIAQAIAEVEFAADDHRCFVGNGPGQLIRIVG